MTRYWFLFLLMIAPLLTGAQQPPVAQADAQESFQFEHYGQTEGLSQGTIKQIVSYDGFMWFGTLDGLNRFDGYGFTVFRKAGPHTLNNNLIFNLLADSQGKLWVATGAGVNIYDSRLGQFQTFTEAFGVNHPVGQVAIQHVNEDKNGRIWIMTTNRGLFCFDRHTRHLTAYFTDNKALQVSCIGPEGQLWVASLNEVFRFDALTRQFRRLNMQQRLRSSVSIQAICFDKKGNLWVGTTNAGAFVLDQQNNVVHYQKGTTAENLSSNDVRQFMCDHLGRVWIATQTGGISLFHPDTKRFTYIRHQPGNPGSLAQDFIWRFFQDQQQTIWVGTTTQGIDKYDPNRFTFGLIAQNRPETHFNLPDRMVFRMLGHKDTLYIGTELGGFARYSFTSRRVIAFPPTVLPNVRALHLDVRGIIADSDGQLWFANRDELSQFDPVRQVARAYPLPIKQANVFSAQSIIDSMGRSGEIWVAGSGGLCRFDMATKQWKDWHDIPAMNAVINYSARHIYQPTPHQIWLSTIYNGLIGYDRRTKRLISLKTKPGLSLCSAVRTVRQTGETLWVGTDCGLYRIDLAKRRVVQHVTTADGLPNDVIYGILPDNSGNLWLSSNKGLTCFSPGRGVLKNYDVSDGLQGNEFNTNACYKHTDGTLFFGGVNGVTFFRPDQFRPNRTVPPIRITGITVLDSTYNPTQSQLSLGPDQNFIRFSFVALNFSNSRKNGYRYRLEGIDPAWVQAGHQRTANYTKLPPGEYVFRVKGSNDDGVWNERGASINITINPPFWATGWFRLGLIALLLSGIYGLYRYRVEQLKSQQAHEMTVTVRTQELERHRFAKELHDGVGANLSVLNLYLSSLGSPNMPVQDVKERSIAVLKASIDEIRSLINDMHPRNLTQQGLAQTIADMVALLNHSKQLTIGYETQNIPDKLSEAIEINLFRVVQELLQNALKHAGASHVRLRLHTEADLLHLAYHDDGRGLDLALLDAPTGNGLVNIRQRITLLKGHCTFGSTTGQGTTVTISVPFA